MSPAEKLLASLPDAFALWSEPRKRFEFCIDWPGGFERLTRLPGNRFLFEVQREITADGGLLPLDNLPDEDQESPQLKTLRVELTGAEAARWLLSRACPPGLRDLLRPAE